jgi:hypothetical protein
MTRRIRVDCGDFFAVLSKPLLKMTWNLSQAVEHFIKENVTWI